MVSSSCSTTMTVLPRSRRRSRVESRRALSRWGRPGEGGEGGGGGRGGELINGVGRHFHGQRFRPQALPPAGGAGRGRHVLLQPLAVVLRLRLLVITLQDAQQAGGAPRPQASGRPVYIAAVQASPRDS